jgi:hypothetical protein
MKYLTAHLKKTKRMQFRFQYSKTALARGRIRDILSHLPEGWIGNPRIVDVEPQYETTRWKRIAFVFFIIVAFYFFFIKLVLNK